MRRPHRSIETFDISLMAVVTKAMGAFLVLMLLLMPYYNQKVDLQHEIGDLEKENQALKQQIEQLKQQIPKDPNALKQLAALQQDRDKLKRIGDENKELRDQIAELQKQQQQDQDALKKEQQLAQLPQTPSADALKKLKEENEELKKNLDALRGDLITVALDNVKCGADADILWARIDQVGSTFTLPDNSQTEYSLDLSTGLGNGSSNSRRYQARPGSRYVILVLGKSKSEIRKLGGMARPLQRPSSTCTATVRAMAFTRTTTNRIAEEIAVNDYAQAVCDVVFYDDGDVSFTGPSAESLAWLKDQIAHAEKVPGGPVSAPAAQASPERGEAPPTRRRTR